MIEAGDNSSPLQLHRISQVESELAAEILAGLAWRPTVAALMILDPSDAAAVRRARVTLRSLVRQGYPNWRAVVIVRQAAGSFDAVVERLGQGMDTVASLRRNLLGQPADLDALRGRLLDGFAEIGERVTIAVRGRQDRLVDIARAHCSDAGPLLFTFLRAGDELSGDAFVELAVATGMDREADFFYSDEQRPKPDSDAVAAFLKPQWSPDLLLSTNYVGRLWCALPELLDRSGATLTELLRLGEYDLVLRCTEQARAIRHIARVLCRRWGDRLDSETAERQALERAVTRRGIAGEVLGGCAPGFHRVKRRVLGNPLVSIIIPTRAAQGMIKTCVTTLRRLTAYRNFEIIVIDDIPAADARSKTWVRDNADKVVAAPPAPFNWSRFNNAAASLADGEYLLFLNDDVEVLEPGWLHAMLGHAQRPEVGIVGARLLYPDDTVQHAGMFLAGSATGRHAFRHKRRDQLGYFGLALAERNVSAVTGACLMTRRDVFWQLGGLNEAHDIINNDLDYCLKIAKQGLLCVYTPYAVLRHHERVTRGDAPDHHDVAAFDRDWRDIFAAGDPYHHPNLSQHVDDLAPDREELQLVHVARPLLRRESLRRILIVKLDHIGDCIGAIPAIRRLKQHFPEARLSVLTGEWAVAIWRKVPEIDETIPFGFFHVDSAAAPRRLLPAELRALSEQLEPYHFDLAIDLRRHPESRHLLRCTGAAYTAGFDYLGQFPWLDIAPEWGVDMAGASKHQHFSETLISLVDAVAAACEREPDLLPITPNDELEFRRAVPEGLFDRRVVCIHAGSGNAMKLWPTAYFVELIDLLVARDGVNVALVGGPGDTAAMAALRDELRQPERVFSLAGSLDLDELPHFIGACSLFVGNDSGPKHIAAGVGVPTVAIHSGQVDAREWGPLGPRAVSVRRKTACSPCYLSRIEDCDRDLACLVELRPRDIYPLCRRLLAIGYGADRGVSKDLR